MEMSGGEALARQLVLEGVTDLFGVPGVQLDFAVDGLAQVRDQLVFRHTRHEQAAAYMADGYARSTGKIGVCMVVPGPGMLNAMAALSTAYACSSPVLAIVGQIPSALIGGGHGILHEVNDQTRTLGTVTKWTGIALTPQEVPGLVHEAFRQLRTGSPAPVGIEIPPDVLKARAEITLVDEPIEPAPVVPDERAVRNAATLLAAAERPVIYVGGGVLAAEASGELRELAELIQAPVVMSLHGRGALDNRHPLALSSLAGRDVLRAADVVLVVGSRFIDGHAHPLVTAAGAKVILLNSREHDLGEPRRSDVDVLSDARLGLAALSEVLTAVERPEQGAVLDAVRTRAEELVALVEPQASWVRALREAIPDDGVLVNELTQIGFLAEVGYPVYGPHTYITPGYQGTLGYGFATALGAKAGNPERVVVSINGDGGFGWNLQELATAKLHGIGLITVVFADGTFGNVQRMQKDQFDGRIYATDLANPDFVKLAEAFGVAGVRVSTPDALVTAIREGAASGEPLLIEVPTGKGLPSPWHLIHEPKA
ncbi:thiamine pyrophosphate-dependent enzyme [Herbiconiux daphne]|uniref:Thiamine pyrophosphate-binding protein n=1 Tax=Herbiconiux daphne TaxID=2970914 RepID=A0ABT2H3M6_9MICO|nr:thiamine pyrophosphate-dependent enzyme [Herbiconiux daphne]MCS5734527.1 thiamine pyrophosphate-binding protein [Herbiconiux daphne]